MRTFYGHLIAVLAITFSNVAYAAPTSPIAPGDIIFLESSNGWYKLNPVTGQFSEITAWNGSLPRVFSTNVSTIAFDVDGAILFDQVLNGQTYGSVTRLNPWTGETTLVRGLSIFEVTEGFVVEPNGDLILVGREQGISRFSRATQSEINLIPVSDDFFPRAITRTSNGRIFVTHLGGISEVDLQAGTTTPVTTTYFTGLDMIANRPDGQLLVQTTGQQYGLFLVDPDTGNTQLFSDVFSPFGEGDFAFDASGALWQVGTYPNGIYRYPPSGGNPTLFPGGTRFFPGAIAVVPLDWTPPPIPEPNAIVLLMVTAFGLIPNRIAFPRSDI